MGDLDSYVRFRFLSPKVSLGLPAITFIRAHPRLQTAIDMAVTRVKGGYDKAAWRQVCEVPRKSSLAVGLLVNELVRRMPAGQAYVNVGTWQGFSLIAGALGNEDKRCIGIDNFSQFEGPRMEANFHMARLAPHAEFHDMDYRTYMSMIHEGPIGVYYYDANHEYQHQLRGLEIAEPFMAKGCYILVDDTNYVDPRKATEDFLLHGQGRYELVADLPCADPGHPTWWNGLMILRKR